MNLNSDTTYESLLTDIKSKKEIEKLNRAQAVSYALDVSASYLKLFEALFNEETGIITTFKKQIAEVNQTNLILVDRIKELEKIQIQSEQYSRKETIEVKGLDPGLPNDQVENKVIEILNKIKDNNEEPYTANDIHACHKLRNKNIVICKFVHRKRMRASITSRKKLKHTDLTPLGVRGKVVLYESMSFHYRDINWRCNQLKKAGIIKNSWFTNGKYKVVLLDDDTPQIVVDIADICGLINKSVTEVNQLCEEWKDKPFPSRHT